MYNTVTEMHIALDLGLQHINSNRKQSISVDHKDMALNYAVLQFIETRTSPKSNRKGEGLEETFKRYEDLEELKRTYKSKVNVSDNNSFIIFPSDYYKFISAGANVKFSKFDLPTPHIDTTIVYHTLLFSDDSSANQTYENFKLTKDGNTIFDATSYKGLPDLYGADSKFMIINLVLEEINKLNDVDIYWESWNNVYKKDSFIIISKHSNYTLSYGKIDNTGLSKPVLSVAKEIKVKHFNIKGDKIADIDLISSMHKYSARNNYHNNRNRHLNPLGIISSKQLVIEQGYNFVVTDCEIEYYKKPRLISYRHNQSCEITVNREIIDLAIQRLKAYIKDEGYQHVVNENQIIE